MSYLQELVDNYAKHTDCKVNMLDNGYGCSISLGPVDLRVMHQPGSNFIVFQIPVGVLPEQLDLKIKCYKLLLEANDFNKDTRGMTLGYNDEAELITLQNIWDITSIDQDKFSSLVFKILKEGIVWMGKLDSRKLATTLADKNSQTSSEHSMSNWLSL